MLLQLLQQFRILFYIFVSCARAHVNDHVSDRPTASVLLSRCTDAPGAVYTHSTRKYSQTSAITNDEKSTFVVSFVCRKKNSANAMRASGHEHRSMSKGTRSVVTPNPNHCTMAMWWSTVNCNGWQMASLFS